MKPVSVNLQAPCNSSSPAVPGRNEALPNHYCLRRCAPSKPSTLPRRMDVHIDQLYWAGEPVGAVDMRLQTQNATGAKIHATLDVKSSGLQLSGENGLARKPAPQAISRADAGG